MGERAGRKWCKHDGNPTTLESHLPAVLARYDGVLDTQAQQVANQRRDALLLQVIRHQDARVPHHLRDVRGLASRGRAHIHDTLPGFSVQGDDRPERRRALQDVVPGEVLRRCTDGDRRIEHLQPDL